MSFRLNREEPPTLALQVGSTNRWRLPATLGSDLLGINQAIRAIRQNQSQSVQQQKKDFQGSVAQVGSDEPAGVFASDH